MESEFYKLEKVCISETMGAVCVRVYMHEHTTTTTFFIMVMEKYLYKTCARGSTRMLVIIPLKIKAFTLESYSRWFFFKIYGIYAD